MTPETLQKITKEAEEKYPMPHTDHEINESHFAYRPTLRQMNAETRIKREAFISGASTWAERE